ncbi:retron St85 family effector protein [Xenorhabdus anantnagensis]|uniref:Retron St85 family effector protein n=1 Tax=Xenorhabdus anantnagensis TaxID=3025875 RepID=A0ABT5LN77_9GAMM|nr:retron St85 family effector protein [Xenorhabdus anantnagensis]MDC9595857.1 retron St85 family effector protein [Xenorhabdus anantnagensis]
MYEETIKDTFKNLDVENFSVNNSILNLIFVCGGLVDVKEAIPSSMRGQLYAYTSSEHEEFHNCLRMAESFKDYIESGQYDDLLHFEHDIAKISSQVLLFLESPGSLVELGIFSSFENLYDKICVIAPENHVESEDSFIFLGPLKRISSYVSNAVLIYPYDSENGEFDKDVWKEICEDIFDRLKSKVKVEKFRKDDDGHLCMLILEIINICFPVQLSEIESVLSLFLIKISQKRLSQLIYLLLTLELIQKKKRSTNTYFFPLKKLESDTYIKFGSYIDKKPFDKSKNKIKLKQELVINLKDKEQRRIRVLAKYGEENV